MDSRKPDLREISHLFLSSVRQRQTGNATPPKRIAPAKRSDPTVDLTPDEFAQVTSQAKEVVAEPRVFGILASHFDGRALDVARSYAAAQSQTGARVGLIEVDASGARVIVVDPEHADSTAGPTTHDSGEFNDALNELGWDIDRWLVVITSPRVTAARELMRSIDRFVLVTSCDSDGVVAAYRSVKGAADTLRRDGQASPKLSLAVFGAEDDAHAEAVFDKLNGVMLQFLSWPLEFEGRIGAVNSPTLAPAIAFRAMTETGAQHWDILARFVSQQGNKTVEEPIAESAKPQAAIPVQNASQEIHDEIPASLPMPQVQAAPTAVASHSHDEVIELPADVQGQSAILSAVIAGAPQGWIECPIRPPMCPDARLAVSRDRALTLIAAPSRGLSDLRAVGEAYQWLNQNRALVAMALPQLAIDAHQLPRLQLLVDHADSSAAAIQPMLQSGNVTVSAYRKLRWSGRMGLLLEAA